MKVRQSSVHIYLLRVLAGAIGMTGIAHGQPTADRPTTWILGTPPGWDPIPSNNNPDTNPNWQMPLDGSIIPMLSINKGLRACGINGVSQDPIECAEQVGVLTAQEFINQFKRFVYNVPSTSPARNILRDNVAFFFADLGQRDYQSPPLVRFDAPSSLFHKLDDVALTVGQFNSGPDEPFVQPWMVNGRAHLDAFSSAFIETIDDALTQPSIWVISSSDSGIVPDEPKSIWVNNEEIPGPRGGPRAVRYFESLSTDSRWSTVEVPGTGLTMAQHWAQASAAYGWASNAYDVVQQFNQPRTAGFDSDALRHIGFWYSSLILTAYENAMDENAYSKFKTAWEGVQVGNYNRSAVAINANFVLGQPIASGWRFESLDNQDGDLCYARCTLTSTIRPGIVDNGDNGARQLPVYSGGHNATSTVLMGYRGLYSTQVAPAGISMPVFYPRSDADHDQVNPYLPPEIPCTTYAIATDDIECGIPRRTTVCGSGSTYMESVWDSTLRLSREKMESILADENVAPGTIIPYIPLTGYQIDNTLAVPSILESVRTLLQLRSFDVSQVCVFSTPVGSDPYTGDPDSWRDYELSYKATYDPTFIGYVGLPNDLTLYSVTSDTVQRVTNDTSLAALTVDIESGHVSSNDSTHYTELVTAFGGILPEVTLPPNADILPEYRLGIVYEAKFTQTSGDPTTRTDLRTKIYIFNHGTSGWDILPVNDFPTASSTSRDYQAMGHWSPDRSVRRTILAPAAFSLATYAPNNEVNLKFVTTTLSETSGFISSTDLVQVFVFKDYSLPGPEMMILDPQGADFNHDGQTTTLDAASFVEVFEVGSRSADINADGDVDAQDVVTFFEHYEHSM